jgi:purine-binding chemotaxis protein CheW
MPKDKRVPSNPLFDDPFAEPDEAQEVRDAEEKTKVDTEKRSAAKTKPASRKQTAKKTTEKTTAGKKAAAKPKAEKKAAAPAKPKAVSRKQAPKKPTAKPKTGNKIAAKPKTEKKAAVLAKPDATSQKRKPKKTTAKPKVEEKITLESKQEVPPTSVMEESSKTVKIEERTTMEAESFVESDQGTTLPLDTSPTLLETLIASLDKDDTNYERRALVALPFVQRTAEIEGDQHVVFYLAEREYAVPIESVIEIGEPLNTTPVPNVPVWVLGVANLRGDILSVVDLRVFLGMPPRYQGEESRMLIMQSGDKEISTCLIVDGVRGIRYLHMDRVAEHTLPATDVMTQFIDGVYKQDENEIMVLDIDRLLLSERMQTFS